MTDTNLRDCRGMGAWSSNAYHGGWDIACISFPRGGRLEIKCISFPTGGPQEARRTRREDEEGGRGGRTRRTRKTRREDGQAETIHHPPARRFEIVGALGGQGSEERERATIVEVSYWTSAHAPCLLMGVRWDLAVGLAGSSGAPFISHGRRHRREPYIQQDALARQPLKAAGGKNTNTATQERAARGGEETEQANVT